MPTETEKIMFMIYKESSYTDDYKVCYFTELNEHNKESEYNKALAGEFYYDGYLKSKSKRAGKKLLDQLIARLNNGENLPPDDIESALGEYLA